MKRTYSFADLKATCVIDYMRVYEIEENFIFFDSPTGPPHDVGGPSGSFCFPGCCLVRIFYFLFVAKQGISGSSWIDDLNIRTCNPELQTRSFWGSGVQNEKNVYRRFQTKKMLLILI